MTTFAQVVERARRRIMTSTREQFNVLGNTVDSDDTSLTITNDIGASINTGTRLDIDFEEMYVSAISGTTPGSIATVIRGINGSTPASHTSGTTIRVGPQWTNFELGQAVNDELADLSSPLNGLFRIKTATDISYNGATLGYALLGVTDLLDVWRVRYDTPGPENVWPVIPPAEWYLDQAASTTDFSSGFQIVLRCGAYPGQPVRVSYKATFDSLSAPADDVLVVSGLHNEAHDILSLGAAIRVLSGEEAKRSYMGAQGNPRRADEVPPRTSVSALAPLVAQREDRVKAEAARLAQRYPQAY